MSHHIIEYKNVNFSYNNDIEVLKDINFKIYHGESVGIIGANGVGKTTLLMLMVGILDNYDGEIRIGDVKLTDKNISFFRQRIGFIFQNPDDQLFMPTVYEDIAFGPKNFNMTKDDIEKSVEYAMNITGISHLRDRPPYKLSAGEKRLVAIASVMALKPDILLLDEPSSFLDPKSRRNVINWLKEYKHTKIITSHDLDMILELCERTIVLKDGKIEYDGPTDTVMKNEELLHKCNLELPLCYSKCYICEKKFN